LKDIHKQYYGTYPKGPKANDLAWLKARISQKSSSMRKSETTNSCKKESDVDDVSVPSDNCEEDSACYSQSNDGSSCEDSVHFRADKDGTDEPYSVEEERASTNSRPRLNILGQKLALKLIPNLSESEINERQDSAVEHKKVFDAE